MLQKKIIHKLLRPQSQKLRMYVSWIGLTFGLLLLCISIQAWVNFQSLLHGKDQEDSMSEFLVAGKKITDENMVNDPKNNLFSSKEISSLSSLNTVEEIAVISANKFPVSARIGGAFGFQTDLFLEAIPNEFLDTFPENWEWTDGNKTLPVILSNDFLDLYNYGFALSQGLPQLSQNSIKSIPFQISIAHGQEIFNAQIVGFTNRISSVLVPESFINSKNKIFGKGQDIESSRLILKVKNPSDAELISYFQEKGYTVNADQLKWNRIGTIVQIIISVVGVIAFFIVGMSVLSFILFLEITIYQSAGHIRLLKEIGFHPKFLRKKVINYFLPWIGSAIFLAAAITVSLHFIFIDLTNKQDLEIGRYNFNLLAATVSLLFLILMLLLKKSSAAVLKKL